MNEVSNQVGSCRICGAPIYEVRASYDSAIERPEVRFHCACRGAVKEIHIVGLDPETLTGMVQTMQDLADRLEVLEKKKSRKKRAKPKGVSDG